MGKDPSTQDSPTPLSNPEIRQADQSYKRDVVIVEGLPFLKRLFLFFWSVVDLVLLAIFFGYFGYYFSMSYFSERADIARIGSNIDVQNAVSVARSANPLLIDDTRVFSLDSGHYDLYAIIENPNEEWHATFTYYFEDGGEQTPLMKGFVLPGEERPVAALRQSFESRPGSVELVVEDVTWRRVDHRQIEDLEEWLADHEAFLIEDASYALDVEVATERFGKSSFTITNESPYGYWGAEFFVLVTRSGSPVGINKVVLSDFLPGEVRQVEVNWFAGAPTSGDVVVIPNIDFFDESVYQSLRSSTEDDIRERF